MSLIRFVGISAVWNKDTRGARRGIVRHPSSLAGSFRLVRNSVGRSRGPKAVGVGVCTAYTTWRVRGSESLGLRLCRRGCGDGWSGRRENEREREKARKRSAWDRVETHSRGRTHSRVAKVSRVESGRSISKATRLQGDLLTYHEWNAILVSDALFDRVMRETPRLSGGLERERGFTLIWRGMRSRETLRRPMNKSTSIFYMVRRKGTNNSTNGDLTSGREQIPRDSIRNFLPQSPNWRRYYLNDDGRSRSLARDTSCIIHARTNENLYRSLSRPISFVSWGSTTKTGWRVRIFRAFLPTPPDLRTRWPWRPCPCGS